MPDDQIDDLNAPPETPPDEPPLELSTSSNVDPAPVAKEKAGVSSSTPASPPPARFTKEEIADLAAGISSGITQGFKPAEPAPVAVAPAGPSVADLQSKIDELDAQIDLAVEEGKPSDVRRGLTRERDRLRDQKFDLEHVAPLRIAGANSINSLILDKMRADPYFVKYEKEVMALLTPALQGGQALTVELAQQVLKLVKGGHTDEIVADSLQEETRRRKLEQSSPLPTSTTGRRPVASAPRLTTVRERFGLDADETLNYKRQKGMDDDQFARRMGFRDKADWFAQDDAFSRPDFTAGLDGVWDARNGRFVPPDELNAFYRGQ